jgi:hypothetical protein
MDQVKTILRALSKHIFWIGCGVIMVVSMSSWYAARSGLKTEFTENLGKIKTSFSSADTLKKKPAPPNEHSNVEMDRLLDDALRKVVLAWQKQYSHQEMILRWPPELLDDFITRVRPLEADRTESGLSDAAPSGTKGRLPPAIRELCRASAAQVGGADQLALDAGALGHRHGTDGHRPGARNGPGTVPGAGQAAGPKPPLVIWEGQDQARLFGVHFDWSKQPDQAPTTLQVLYAQEDLWVLTALMYIIRNTNGEIESRHEAVVKTIESVMIGRSAVGRAGQVVMLAGQMPMAGGEGMGMEGGMSEGSGASEVGAA